MLACRCKCFDVRKPLLFTLAYGNGMDIIGNNVLQGGHHFNDVQTFITFLLIMQFRALNTWREKGVTGTGKEDSRITWIRRNSICKMTQIDFVFVTCGVLGWAEVLRTGGCKKRGRSDRFPVWAALQRLQEEE